MRTGGATAGPHVEASRRVPVHTQVKLAITKYLVGGATKDVSTALEMLMTENIAQLPAEATEEALDFRERELYTQQTEAIFLRDLPSLRCLFECYADGGGGGRADLMSVSEFDQLLTHTRLYDAEFTRREAARAFARARMRVVDELKHRNKLIHLSFVDFLEAHRRAHMHDMHMHMYIHMCTCIHVCTCACGAPRVHVCVRGCVYLRASM